MAHHPEQISQPDSESDDDEWYDRMVEAAKRISDNQEIQSSSTGEDFNSHGQVILSEEAYFQNVLDRNCEISDNIFAPETDPLWYKLLKDNARHNQMQKSSGKGELYQLELSHYSGWKLIDRFLTSFLPSSSKIHGELCTLCNLEVRPAGSPQPLVFTDDLVHPSMVAYFKPNHTVERLEISLFSPYGVDAMDWNMFLRTLAGLQKRLKLLNCMYTGIDGTLLENGVLVHSKPGWELKWTELCDMVALQETAATARGGSSNTQRAQLPDGYVFTDLSENDAYQVNGTWKYKSEGSLEKIKDMIKCHPCVGVLHSLSSRTTKESDVGAGAGANTDADSEPSAKCKSLNQRRELVCWCLTYSYGALGMLYTQESHRGNGLAKAAVMELLARQQVGAQHPLVLEGNAATCANPSAPAATGTSASQKSSAAVSPGPLFSRTLADTHIIETRDEPYGVYHPAEHDRTGGDRVESKQHHTRVESKQHHIHPKHPQLQHSRYLGAGALQTAFAFIEQRNYASKELFRSLGFSKVGDYHWAGSTLHI